MCEPHATHSSALACYRQRILIKRAFAKSKQFRRFATPLHEKLREVSLGQVRLALGFIHVKKLAQAVNTPLIFGQGV
jgi:transposase